MEGVVELGEGAVGWVVPGPTVVTGEELSLMERRQRGGREGRSPVRLALPYGTVWNPSWRKW